jgi:hypothetical protein
MGNGTKTYTQHKGKYTFDWTTPGTTTQWLRAMDHGGSMDGTRLGLLHPVEEIMMFTVGLGLEHHAMPPIAAETRTVWPGEVMDNTYALCTDTVVNPACKESGTLEYNLWRIANTSGAEYFYAPDAEDLEGIFDEIARILSTGFNQTRSSEAVAPNEGTSNFDKQAISPAVDLSGYQTAKLSFWHKYNLLPGGNGGVLGVEVWDAATSTWKFLYIIPSGVYTGGLYYKETEYDDFGNRIQWCFNGVSGGGTFGWDHVEIDILPYIPSQYRSRVRVAFHYMQFGGGTGAGWYLDDVQLRAGRGDAAIGAAHKDVWALTNTASHGGNYSWWNHNTTADGLKPGIDNVLTTIPIDLTSAVQATLNAYLKFNINTAEGIPPDCVRVEVTSDGGATWNAVNLGVRAVWGVAGTGADMDDGKLDGKTYTGLDPDGDGWIAANTLSRLNVDLSAWRGHQIQVRFRVVASNDPGYLHYANHAAPWGVYIDDVTITGLTKYS